MALTQVFSALSDPTRFAIVEQLMRGGEQTVGDLAKPFAMSAPAISRHMKVLEDAGLIERRIEKQWRMCRLRKERFQDVSDWFEQCRLFWDSSFDRLDEVFAEDSVEEKRDKKQ